VIVGQAAATAEPRTGDAIEIAPVRPRSNGDDGFWWDHLLVEGQTAGTVAYSLSADRREMSMDKLYVLEAERRRGYAGRLIKHVIERAHASGCVRVTLTVAKSNPGAIRAYLKHGFDVDRTLMGDHLIMVRNLSINQHS
jgi:GNAT superfamily N-acetyltransferase